ncbi:MAG TPA: 2-oxoacid:ferredoxin oxidoreductase subunit beta [Saprospiraceae bacterium]|nr:2-oxoacid:ferredoxin oxidoreductase subunit beta [Saprospiraceae bacterium]
MSYKRPSFRHPASATNSLGFHQKDYEGALSTLCAGCGHDSISAAIIQACFELAIPPHRIAKVSGIGCSSKTPTYFMGNSHGFNSVHGRMPSVATGAVLANRDLTYIGVSGDGDTASIGMGQFAHVVRRNLNMLYVVMNNGCYGLTKGQDSATADPGSIGKAGNPTMFSAIDLAGLALELGAGFVARSFSGDKEQLIPLIKAGIAHKGFALLDVLSPCVTFNNTMTSTKSYTHVRDHMESTSIADFVPEKSEITASIAPGENKVIEMHDGSELRLQALASGWDPTNRLSAINAVHQANEKGDVLTGLIFIDPQQMEVHEILNTVDKPLNEFGENDLMPGIEALADINASYR